MTVKTRGIRLKDHLAEDDQGQIKLIQGTYSQLWAPPPLVTAQAPRTDLPPVAPGTPDRRRVLARMLRVELEAVLTLLDQTLAGLGPRPGPD
jgi:hypothetical protein